MSSPEQIDANQRNGALSQGPKTPEGKAASAQNARKHGLLSQGLLLPDEDKDEFDRFAQSLHGELNPQGELEHALVVRIVGLLWRLRRAGKLETGVLFWQQCLVEGPPPIDAYPHGEEDPRFRDYLIGINTITGGEKQAEKAGAPELATFGRAYIGGENSLAKLSRYESAIQRNLVRALHELQRLQAARKGEHVPPPVVVDIDVSGLPEQVTPSDESGPSPLT
jgi:hypothetical protein